MLNFTRNSIYIGCLCLLLLVCISGCAKRANRNPKRRNQITKDFYEQYPENWTNTK